MLLNFIGKTSLTAIKPKDISFFNPDFNIQLIELKDNYNICYNILSCINRLKVKLQSIDTRFLTRNLDTYLFNKVDNQYTNSLLSVARINRFNSLNRIDK